MSKKTDILMTDSKKSDTVMMTNMVERKVSLLATLKVAFEDSHDRDHDVKHDDMRSKFKHTNSRGRNKGQPLLEEEEHELLHWSLIHPNRPFRQVWDVLITIFVLYLVITVPLSIAFGNDTMKHSFFSGFSNFLEAFFWCDIVLNFRTGFDHGGHIEFNQWEIIKHYLLIDPPGCDDNKKHDHGKKKTWVGYIPKGWFVVDFIASFPFDLILLDARKSTGKKGRKAVKFLKIFKLTKLLRLGRIIRKMPDYFKYRLVFYCLFFLVVASHMFACLWISIQGLDIISERPPGFYTDELVSNGSVSTTNVYFAALDGTILQLFLISDIPILLGTWSEFNNSLVEGSGSVWEETSGKNVYSHILSIIICVLGATLQSFIWALVYKLVTNNPTMRERFRTKIEHMTEEMETLQFPKKLQHQVIKYYQLLWKNQESFYGNSFTSEYITTDRDLCHTLKVKLARHLTSLIPGARDIELFKGCSDESLGVIVNKMRVHFFVKGKIIWQKDTVVRDLIYISKGQVIDTPDLENVGLDSTICTFKFYGEQQLLGRVDAKFGRYLVAISKNLVEVAVFPKAIIMEVLTEYQENESILLELQQCAAVDGKHVLLDHTLEEKESGNFPKSITQRIQTTEKRLDEIESKDNQILENVKRLKDWTSKMDTKMENVIQLINKSTQNRLIAIP